IGHGSGVYQSIDDGLTWSLFPSTTFGAVVQGGDLPHAAVTDLDLSLGNIDSHTGMPNLAGPLDPTNGTPTTTPDPDVRLASTHGRGSCAINVGRLVVPSTVAIGPSSGTPANVTTARPIFHGLSSFTGFGNATRITIVDETPGDATLGKVIGGF